MRSPAARRPARERPPRGAGRGVRALPLLLLGVLLAHPLAYADPLDEAKEAELHDQPGLAVDLFAEVLRADPQSRDAALGLARTMGLSGRWDAFTEAEKALRALHEEAADDRVVHLALARLYLERSRVVEQPLFRRALQGRAEATFASLLEADPAHEQAAVGLARTLMDQGEADRAIGVLDAFLAGRPPAQAQALIVKGRLLYEQAQAAHQTAGGGYPLPGDVQRLYARAQGACLSGAMADPTSFDAWIHVGWASMVLGDRETALTAYERAYALDPSSPLPLKGLAALNAHDPEAREAALDALRRLDPAPRRQGLQEIYDALEASDWDAVLDRLRAYEATFGEDADVAYLRGRLVANAGDEEEAVRRYERALGLDGDHLAAAEELDRRLRVRAIQRARNSVAMARAVYDDYRRLMDLAPRNPYLRNNCAFALREAWKPQAPDPAWREVLLLCVRTYEEAARIIGPAGEAAIRAVPWARRYGYAQIVNDAGVVFQEFEPTRDLERAERYYRRALDWSEGGYLDAWTYLRQIYEGQARWQDLHDLARRAAASLRSEDGTPLEAPRAAAAKVADDLEAQGLAR